MIRNDRDDQFLRGILDSLGLLFFLRISLELEGKKVYLVFNR